MYILLLVIASVGGLVSGDQCAVEKQIHRIVIKRKIKTVFGFTYDKENFEVVSVVDFGPAYIAGLKQGDKIIGGQGMSGNNWAHHTAGVTSLYLTVSREPPLEGVWASSIGRLTAIRQNNYHLLRFSLLPDIKNNYPSWTESSTTHTIKPCINTDSVSLSLSPDWCSELFTLSWIGPMLFVNMSLNIEYESAFIARRIHPLKTALQRYAVDKNGIIALTAAQVDFALASSSRILIFITAADCVACIVSDNLAQLQQEFSSLRMARITIGASSGSFPQLPGWGVSHVPALLYFQWGKPIAITPTSASKFLRDKLINPLCLTVTEEEDLALIDVRLLVFVSDSSSNILMKIVNIAVDNNPALSCVVVPQQLMPVGNGTELVLLKNLPYHKSYEPLTEPVTYVNVMKILGSHNLKPTVIHLLDSNAAEADVLTSRAVFFKPRHRFDSDPMFTKMLLERFVQFSKRYKRVIFIVVDAATLGKQSLHSYGYSLRSTQAEIKVFTSSNVGGYAFDVGKTLDEPEETMKNNFHKFLGSVSEGRITVSLQTEPLDQVQSKGNTEYNIKVIVGDNMTANGKLKSNSDGIMLVTPDYAKQPAYLQILKALANRLPNSSNIFVFNSAQNEGAPVESELLNNQIDRLYVAAKNHPDLSGHYVLSKWSFNKKLVWQRIDSGSPKAYLYSDSTEHWVIGSFGEMDSEAVWVSSSDSQKEFPYQATSWQFWDRSMSKWRLTPYFIILSSDLYLVKYINGNPVRFCGVPELQRKPSIGNTCAAFHLAKHSIDEMINCLRDD